MKRDHFAERVANLVQASNKTKEEIASALGYTRPSVIAAFESGLIKVPFAKVPTLAAAVGVEPTQLMREALAAYAPDLLTALESCVGRLTPGREPFVRS